MPAVNTGTIIQTVQFDGSVITGTFDIAAGVDNLFVQRTNGNATRAGTAIADPAAGTFTFTVNPADITAGTTFEIQAEDDSVIVESVDVPEFTTGLISQMNSKLDEFATQVGLDQKAQNQAVGKRADLTTTVKTTVVAAINSIKSESDAVAADLANNYITTTAAQAAIATAKTEAVAAAVAQLTGDSNIADAAKDTLSEIISFIETLDGDQQAIIDNLLNAKNVRYDEVQTLTEAEKLTARSNIGAVSSAEVTTAAETAATNEVDARVGTGTLDDYLALYLAAKGNDVI